MTPYLYSGDPEVLQALLANPHFGEREALLLLKQKDLPASVIRRMAGLAAVRDRYSVRLALSRHPKTPLGIALEQLKFLYLFDLVSLCVQPGIPTAVRLASEESILAQIPKLPAGQRITLAKRGSARLAASLLMGENSQVIQAALENPHLTEAALLRVLNRSNCGARIVESIAAHQKWGLRYDIRLALLRHSSLPLARALAILPALKFQDAQAIAKDSASNPQFRRYLLNRLKR
jgi:hypothetical protein